MNMDDDALGRNLSALKAELSSLRPPPSVDRALTAAIARAERAAAAPVRPWRRALRDYALPASAVFAASLAIMVWMLRTPPAEPVTEQAVTAPPAATEFIPIVPVADIARTRGAYVVSTQMPRTMLADFGLPVSPTRAADSVASELLVRADGTVLAVRFLE